LKWKKKGVRSAGQYIVQCLKWRGKEKRPKPRSGELQRAKVLKNRGKGKNVRKFLREDYNEKSGRAGQLFQDRKKKSTPRGADL